MPYDDVSGCRSGQAPNGAPSNGSPGNGDDPGDDEISVVSHEHNETIDDPFANGWRSTGGDESADLCAAPVTRSTTFGNPLSSSLPTSSGNAYNQTLGNPATVTHNYWLQDEWANADPGSPSTPFDACEQRPGGTPDIPPNPSEALTYHGGPVVDAHTVYAIFWNPTGAAAPPTASLAVSNPTGHAGVALTFNASASKGSNLTYTWNFGDGQPPANGAVVQHAFAAPGSYTVTLTVQDGVTQYTASQQQLVAVYPNPVAVFSAPASGTAGTAIAFDAGGSTVAVGTPTLTWSFGDGTSSQAGTGAVTSHAYAAAGSYTVTLTVQDAAGGRATASRTIQVAAAPKPPPPGGGSQPRTSTLTLSGSGKPHVVLSGGKVILIVGETAACPAGGQACKVTVLVTAPASGSSGSTVKQYGTVSVGAETVTIAAGHTVQLQVRLSKAAVTTLRDHRSLRATVKITTRAGGTAGPSKTITRTVAAPKALKKHVQ